MNNSSENKQIKLLVSRYPELGVVQDKIMEAYKVMEQSYVNGGKLLVAGNGGSAADAEHIVGELMKGFKLPRKPEKEFAENLLKADAKMGDRKSVV